MPMKQKMKRALWLLVCLMAMECVNAQTIVTVDGLQYSLNGAYASVYSVAEGNTSNRITIPASITHEGLAYTVNGINIYAFSWYGGTGKNQYVQEIILPNTIETISEYAFRNSNITNVELAEGVKTIGSHAFE